MTSVSQGIVLEASVRVFDLEQPRFEGMPVHEAHFPGYVYSLHRRHGDGRNSRKGPRAGASGVIFCMEHAGTHIDALCHQSENERLFGGVDAIGAATAKGFSKLGVEEIAPIVAPGLLLDIARHRGVDSLKSGNVVTAADLISCAKSQGMSIEAGSVVLIRTGNGQFWNNPKVYLPGPGMDGSAAKLMAESKVLATGSDTMAWDAIGLFDEELGCELPAHVWLLVRSGIYIIENVNLEELAAAQQYEFSFVCTPLSFTGATGSPVRPIAIVKPLPRIETRHA